jgi:hypothetical protein
MGMIEASEQSVSDPIGIESARDLFAGSMSSLLAGFRFFGESDSLWDRIGY